MALDIEFVRGQFPAFAIIPDNPDKRDRQAERSKVSCHIARTARHRRFAGAPHDRHRRFGGYAGDAAIDKPVQHDIANTDNTLARSGVDETRKMCA